MTIGDAARQLGVETHVLRYWDEVGALRPSARTSAGHRRYTPTDIDRGRVAMRCQRAGLSLADIAGLADRTARTQIVVRNLNELHAQRERIDHAAAFLEHVLECTHPIIEECPGCTEFAAGS